MASVVPIEKLTDSQKQAVFHKNGRIGKSRHLMHVGHVAGMHGEGVAIAFTGSGRTGQRQDAGNYLPDCRAHRVRRGAVEYLRDHVYEQGC